MNESSFNEKKIPVKKTIFINLINLFCVEFRLLHHKAFSCFGVGDTRRDCQSVFFCENIYVPVNRRFYAKLKKLL